MECTPTAVMAPPGASFSVARQLSMVCAEADDAVERSAHLVAHRREELPFGLLGGEGKRLGLAQLQLALVFARDVAAHTDQAGE